MRFFLYKGDRRPPVSSSSFFRVGFLKYKYCSMVPIEVVSPTKHGWHSIISKTSRKILKSGPKVNKSIKSGLTLSPDLSPDSRRLCTLTKKKQRD